MTSPDSLNPVIYLPRCFGDGVAGRKKGNARSLGRRQTPVRPHNHHDGDDEEDEKREPGADRDQSAQTIEYLVHRISPRAA